MKFFLRRVLGFFSLNIRSSVAPGLSILGLNIFRDVRPGPQKFRAQYALERALEFKPTSVLDVGSGGGYHAEAFVNANCRVLCIDFGTSIYAAQHSYSQLDLIKVDFNSFEPVEKFDLVWASHVLEHQRNVGSFVDRLISCCSPEGHVCITLPDPHRNLWGGHLSVWSPGLLAYNVALCGIDLSKAFFVRGTNEFSLFFKPLKTHLPKDLTFDSGDLKKLSKYLPSGLTENSDPWRVNFNNK